jgi:hypothetical protein
MSLGELASLELELMGPSLRKTRWLRIEIS